jgi:hypothetical protein
MNASHGKGVEFISYLEKDARIIGILSKISDYCCINYKENKIYFITNSFEADYDVEGGVLKNMPKELIEFDNQKVNNYLETTIRLIRLYKEGNIRIPKTYYYLIENGIPEAYMTKSTTKSISMAPYHLEESELDNLYKFLKETKLPFKKPFLSLAFENFEKSYEISNQALSYLSSMISLEVLLNPGITEVTYRISRNLAVLLGRDVEESLKIFEDMQKLYKKRSSIVHSGKSDVTNEEMNLIRNYVRESIKKIYYIGKEKKEILNQLDSAGFGNSVSFKS